MNQQKGLEGVVAAQTAISDIDVENSCLLYAGYNVTDLVHHSTFEEVIYLLHHRELPTSAQLEQITAQLSAERDLSEFTRQLMVTLASTTSPMSMLRTLVSAASAYDPDGWVVSTNHAANYRKAIRLVARLPQMIASHERLRGGKWPVEPDPKLGHAANLLYVLTGEYPSDEDARIMDQCLVMHADHTMNASTFAARVTAGTLSDIHSAMTSAIATLKGPLHGGANEQVFEMILKIGSVEAVPEDIKGRLARKEKIMGFGHRVYKGEDPRATILRELARDLGARKGDMKWFDISEKIFEVVKTEKGLFPNVDFYAAAVYHYLGIPKRLFTPIFAASRIAGWTAHVIEQLQNNRLIRPDSEYIGPGPRDYVKVEDR
ncbi:MAG TPA: citrate/2-methylcitrate synthase [Actinomycetota bacterium]|nr:citrate/2-methylcitrate synthase [Actinomycetota bacterium]